MSKRKRPRILAIASSGGHWVQLMRVVPAFEGAEVIFVAVSESYREQVPDHVVHVVNDANRWNRWGSFVLGIRMAWVVIRTRPDVVFSTGAAPGFFGVLFGRMLGARAIWLDSIANAEELSMSGRMARRFCDAVLTQWPDLAAREGVEYAGAVF